VWDSTNPVFESLLIVGPEVCPTPFHLQQETFLPENVGKPHTFGSMNSILKSGARLLVAGVPKRLKKAIAEDLRLAFLVARKTGGIGHKFLKTINAHCHRL
jgi:hypothetical protein